MYINGNTLYMKPVHHIKVIKDKLRLPKRETLQLDTKYNVPLP